MPNYRVFFDESPATPCGAGIIGLGLLPVMAIRIMRVAFAVISFIIRKDQIYVGVAIIVRSVLLFRLAGDGR